MLNEYFVLQWMELSTKGNLVTFKKDGKCLARSEETNANFVLFDFLYLFI